MAGVVNDQNAAKLGGVAGHAGLFGTATDLARFAQFMLRRGALPDGRHLVTPETVRLFTDGARLYSVLNVAVTDDKCSPLAFVGGDTNSDRKLDASETWTYTCTTALTSTTTNTAKNQHCVAFSGVSP